MAKSRNQLDPTEMGAELISEIMGPEFHNSSDRVIAVVGAAYLESTLERLLYEAFVDAPDEVDGLLRPDGPLGANGTRCQLAYCLGLITREQRDDLKTIAKIRNSFAHNFRTSTFDDSPVRDFCDQLKQPQLLAAMPARLFSSPRAEAMAEYVRNTTETRREKFRTSIVTLFGSLFRRIRYIRRLTAPGWFSYDPDALTGPQA